MKKLIFTAIICLALTAGAYAASQYSILFTGKTSTGDGTAAFTSETDAHSVTCYFTNTSTVTGLIVRLKGSIDNEHYDSWATHIFDASELSKKQATFHIANKPASSIMGNISSITKTGSISVTCRYKPHYGYK